MFAAVFETTATRAIALDEARRHLKSHSESSRGSIRPAASVPCVPRSFFMCPYFPISARENFITLRREGGARSREKERCEYGGVEPC